MQNNQPNLLDHVDQDDNIQIPLYDQNNKNNVRSDAQGGDTQNILNDFGKKLYLDQTSHPLACVFTFAFKIPACLLYIICSWFVGDYVYAFISAVVCQALDFWVTKNITGRLLVGLRWWSVIQPDGKEKWMFESKNTERAVNQIDYYFFWGTLVCNFGFWAVFCILNILGFSIRWVLINVICLVLLGTNIFCFYKCSKDQQAKVSQLKSNIGAKIAQKGLSTLFNNALGGGK